MRFLQPSTSWILLLPAILLLSCAAPAPDTAPPATPQKLATEHLPNAVRVSEKVISGGQPEGDAAFAELASLGVKTVISVDGTTPDVETAGRHGLRYVHLPHGYDGIPQERVKELAKAVRDLDGPIYIHCHHGKHRSPTAATVACVSAGFVTPDHAISILQLAGTSENYRGLYQSAAAARPLDAELLDALQVEFHESVELPPLAEAMVDVEHTHDHLLRFATAGWQLIPEHPDLEPAHEALILREHFTELLRADYVQDEPAAFKKHLNESETAARELETEIRQWQQSGEPTAPPRLESTLGRVTANCSACHAEFRDVPLSEK